MEETWREIPGYPAYQASDLGRIRSIPRIVKRTHPDGRVVEQPLKGKILKLFLNKKNGYLYVCFYGKFIQVHRLVALTWVPGFEPGLDAAHDDNCRTNNVPGNLFWKTRKANLADQIRHGTRLQGETHPGAVLTADDVRALREMRRTTGASWRVLGEMFGVATMTAKNAVVGNTWKHIE